MSKDDELPDTKRTPAEERLAEALRVIADILEESKRENAEGLSRLETSMINAIGGVKDQQNRDYSRVTRLDEEHIKALASIESGISKILKVVEPTMERLDAHAQRIADLERKNSNGAAAHQ